MDTENLPRIPTDEEPTIFNDRAGKWAFFGSAASGIATIIYLGGIATSGLFPALVGASMMFGGTVAFATIGGLLGKKEMEENLVHGKEVKSPTFWNDKFRGGFALGALLSFSAAIGIKALSIAFDFPITGLAESILETAPIILAGGAGINGGLKGKAEMERDVQTAREIQAEQLGLGHSKERGLDLYPDLVRGHGQASQLTSSVPMHMNSVSPEEASILESRLKAQTPEPAFAQAVMEAREAPDQELPQKS